MALLVALISVATAATPVLQKAILTPQSNSSISTPVIQGTDLTFSVSNVGDGAALFESGQISSSFLGLGPVTLRLPDPKDAVIKFGSQPITLKIDWKRDASDAGHLADEMSKIQGNPESADVGFIKIRILETDGSEKEARFPISAYDVGQIATAKYKECKDVEPSKDANCSSTFGSGSDY